MIQNPLFIQPKNNEQFNSFQYRIDESVNGLTIFGRAHHGLPDSDDSWTICRTYSSSSGIVLEYGKRVEGNNSSFASLKWSERNSYFTAANIVLDSWFVLVQKQDFSESLLNRSTHHDVSELTEYVSKGLWAKIFPTSTHYYIIEVEKTEMKITNIYDNFEWLTKEEVTELLQAEA